MARLGVHLRAGETWRFEPPAGHTVAWVVVGESALTAPAALRTGDLVACDESGSVVTCEVQTDMAFVLGSGVQHPHDLIMGLCSVRTSAQTLRQGQVGIRERAQSLRQRGRMWVRISTAMDCVLPHLQSITSAQRRLF